MLRVFVYFAVSAGFNDFPQIHYGYAVGNILDNG
jgi:hypothetical protein